MTNDSHVIRLPILNELLYPILFIFSLVFRTFFFSSSSSLFIARFVARSFFFYYSNRWNGSENRHAINRTSTYFVAIRYNNKKNFEWRIRSIRPLSIIESFDAEKLFAENAWRRGIYRFSRVNFSLEKKINIEDKTFPRIKTADTIKYTMENFVRMI